MEVHQKLEVYRKLDVYLKFEVYKKLEVYWRNIKAGPIGLTFFVGSLGLFKILSIIQLTHFKPMFIFLLEYKYIFQRKKSFAKKAKFLENLSYVFPNFFRKICIFSRKLILRKEAKNMGFFSFAKLQINANRMQ